jgi:hypothetical protein
MSILEQVVLNQASTIAFMDICASWTAHSRIPAGNIWAVASTRENFKEMALSYWLVVYAGLEMS